MGGVLAVGRDGHLFDRSPIHRQLSLEVLDAAVVVRSFAGYRTVVPRAAER